MPLTRPLKLNRGSRALVAAACAGLFGVVAIVVGALYGLANSGGDPQHPGTPNSTVEVTFALDDQGTTTTRVELTAVDCLYLTTQASVLGDSAKAKRVFAGGGKPDELFISLHFGGYFFVAADSVALKNDTIDLKDVQGQVNAWANDAPGPVVDAAATISGTVTCTTVEH